MLKTLIISAFLISCSVIEKVPEPTTAFLKNSNLMSPAPDRFPWDAVWIKDPTKMLVKQDILQKIYISPVKTDYLNLKTKDDQQISDIKDLDPADISGIGQALKDEFAKALIKHPETNLQVVDNSQEANIVLAIALTELQPTVVLDNVLADVGSMVIPGSKLIEEATSVGAAAAGGALAAGSIAIEFKILDAASNEILAEVKDKQSDPASILPNVKDFEKYGWADKEIGDWAQQFAEAFSKVSSEKVTRSSGFSFLPW